MKNIYLALAVIGAIIPFIFFFQFIQAEGFNIPAFISALFSNNASAGFSTDLLLSSFIFWVFMFRHKKGPNPYLFIALNLFIGLSCALPAYLYAREKDSD